MGVTRSTSSGGTDSSPTSTSSEPSGGSLGFLARAGGLGFLGGAVVSVLTQLAVALLSMDTTLLWRHRIVGVLLLGATYGLVASVVSLPALFLPRARRAVAIAVATVLSLFLCLHVIGVIVRVLSGAHLTYSALLFCVSSWQHFAHAGFLGYAKYTVPVFLLCIAVAYLGYRVLRHQANRRVRPLNLTPVVGSAFVLAGWQVAPTPRAFAAGVARTAPELSVAFSVARSRHSGEESAEVRALASTALESPPLAAGALWRANADDAKGPRPNVVFIMLESISVKHLGYLGYDRPATPNLDRLAERSLVGTHVWATATHSNYAQMSSISSLFPRRGDSLDMYSRLDYPRVLLHDVTTGLGYSAATISSQDETWQGMWDFQQTDAPVHYVHAPDHDGPHLDTGTEQIVPDHITASRAISWIDQQGGPWSLYLNFQATHFPYPIPESAARPFQPDEPEGIFSYVGYSVEDRDRVVNRYDNALRYVDEQVGRLVSHLDKIGQLDRTMIVITADHGEMFHYKDMVTHGRTLYDEEARVPLIIHYPRKVAPERVGFPISQLDIMPTVLALMGLPPHPAFQGRSILDGPEDRPGIFLNIQGWTHHQGIVCYPYKLVQEDEPPILRLFNLESDPDENDNRADAEPEVVAALLPVLRGMMSAQDYYHSLDSNLRSERYAPRMLTCPAL